MKKGHTRLHKKFVIECEDCPDFFDGTFCY